MASFEVVMPPKFDPNTLENVSLISLFTSLGLTPNSATELVRQPKSSSAFKSLIDEYHLEGSNTDERQAAALVKLSAVGAKLGKELRGYIMDRILKGDVRSPDQVAGRLCSNWQVIHTEVTQPLSDSSKIALIVHQWTTTLSRKLVVLVGPKHAVHLTLR